ncbi:MAG: hypothetical protein Q4A76_10945, partial [Porphyromonadaceae bacterium]|nr:hypothetical protein [Porphyromonadaceae bacterium]
VFEYLNPSTIELYVPKESIDAYKADETWGQFLIKELDVTSSKTVEPNQCLAFVQNRQLVIQNSGQNFVDTCVFTMEGTLIYQGM